MTRLACLLTLLVAALGCDADSADCVVPKYPEACCCQGDVVWAPVCGSDGLTCKAGSRLYFGDDCQCIAGRKSPCCTPDPPDTGTPDTAPPDSGVLDSAAADAAADADSAASAG
ncbi:MAG: hypothetical protein HYV09_41475 [Deltaproteobacteria bacterium]|nr:hypothetical protein [Deltaproteobacteria bacterium]